MATAKSSTYIIIGGGTAGLVVANRLSEDANVSILVIEAGKDLSADPRVNVPALWTTLLGSEADWQYQTTTQPGLCGRSIKEPQGKTLGGSSAINGQAWIAPSQAGIDAWAKLGNPGWNWAGFLPYYKKMYTLSRPSDAATLNHLGIDWINEDCIGTSGPLKVSFPGLLENPLCKAWIDAFRSINKITTGDPYSGNSVGGYSNAASVDSETKSRSSAVTAYGIPARERPNLRIIVAATVQKILFTKTSSGTIATGVEVSIEGSIRTFMATKEVILSAGTFNTPKLLELSGVGQKAILEKHGISVVVDLPGVGENLQDHLMTGVSFEVVDGVVTGDALMRREPEAVTMAQKLYAEHKSGPLTIGGIQSHAFMPLDEYADLLDRPPLPDDDEDRYNAVRSIIQDQNGCSAAWFMYLVQANLHQAGKSFIGTQFMPEDFISLGCIQSHPFSVGSTHICSADPEAGPNIDPRYLSHPADLEIMARHVQTLELLRQTKELSVFFKPNGKRNHPDAFHISNLEVAKKYVVDTATSAYHACGSAAMLPREKRGVVDSELRVYGIQNLRIVDASIMPLIPRGNIMSTVYAVAEKAVDIIKMS